jgi:hypothetical protein
MDYHHPHGDVAYAIVDYLEDELEQDEPANQVSRIMTYLQQKTAVDDEFRGEIGAPSDAVPYLHALVDEDILEPEERDHKKQEIRYSLTDGYEEKLEQLDTDSLLDE